MKPEQQLWTVVRPLFTRFQLDPHRVENTVGSGTPDVNYTHGWVELKHQDKFPVRTSTPVIIKTLVARKFQVPWLMARWAAGGLSWLLIRVGVQWFLFAGWDALDIKKGLERSEFEARAVWSTHVTGRTSADEQKHLKAWLTGDADSLLPGDRAKFYRLKAMFSVQRVADELGWPVSKVVAAEADHVTLDTDDLLAFWEN